jgi:serine O-acetyltransferase
MAQHQAKLTNPLDKVDPVWARVRTEAEEVVRREPELSSFIYATVLHHDTLEAAVVHRVGERLQHRDVSAELIRQAYDDALESEPQIGDASVPTSSRPWTATRPPTASSSRCSISRDSTPS